MGSQEPKRPHSQHNLIHPVEHFTFSADIEGGLEYRAGTVGHSICAFIGTDLCEILSGMGGRRRLAGRLTALNVKLLNCRTTCFSMLSFKKPAWRKMAVHREFRRNSREMEFWWMQNLHWTRITLGWLVYFLCWLFWRLCFRRLGYNNKGTEILSLWMYLW